mgnify:FL=1|tara:strand:+ start:397 stop:1518 length:1122 start_codon:yes stop_codon:yes gene_type:complete
MSAIRINVVHRLMPATMPEPIDRPDLGAVILWTREEHPDADVVLCYNAYSYDPNLARKYPDRIRLLVLAEPAVVHPPQYRQSCWAQFDGIVSWNRNLVERSDRFYHVPHINYGLPFPGDHAYPGTHFPEAQLRSRINGVCMVANVKLSLLASQLYSTRARVARWFHDASSMPFDAYGPADIGLPNYRGKADVKSDVLSRYRYTLAFENSHDPYWSRGYLTEKIWDALHSCTIPIYFGDPNVADVVPKDCYIDFRDFESLRDLESALASRTEQDYLETVDRIGRFLGEHEPEKRYHADALYRAAIDAANDSRHRPSPRTTSGDDLPPDYPSSGIDARERILFELSCFILRFPFVFRLLRFGVSRIIGAWRSLRR